MEPGTSFKLKAICCCIFSLFCIIYSILTGCNSDTYDIILLENGICLAQREGNLNGGYSLELKEDEHFSNIIIEPNPIETYYNPTWIFVVQRDNNGLTTYYKVSVHKRVSNSPKAITLKKDVFYKEVKNCTTCKMIRLALDSTRNTWTVKKQ